jgi:hypothetical protein
MRRKVAISLGVASCAATLCATPSFAQDVGGGCVGSAVSMAAHTTQQDLGEGLGAFYKVAGENPGQQIQAYRDAVCTGP